MNRTLHRFAGPLMALASLTLLGVVAEVALRIRHAQKTTELRAKYSEHDLCTEADPVLVYRYMSGRCGFNERGFRDEDRDPTPAPGVFRFVVIGDAVAVGDGVQLEERFDRVLAKRLEGDGIDVEPVNLARTGYSLSQELILLERDAYAYRPDLVVWSYVLNDPAHPVFHNANGRLGRYWSNPTVHSWHRLKRLVFKTRERMAESRCGEEFHTLLHCAYADEIAANIRRIGELSKQHGVPTVFVIHPIFEAERDYDEYSFLALHAVLAARAAESGLVVVDLLDAYRSHDPDVLRQEGEPGWFDPWHPNARGHALAAEALTPVVRRIAESRRAFAEASGDREPGDGKSGDEHEAGDRRGESEYDGGAAEPRMRAPRVAFARFEAASL